MSPGEPPPVTRNTHCQHQATLGFEGALRACLWVQGILLRCKAMDVGADASQAAVLRLPKVCITHQQHQQPP